MGKRAKQSPASLLGTKGHGAGHPRIRADKIDELLILLNNNFPQRAAARIARISHGSVFELLKHPSVIARREELRQEALKAVPVASRALQAFAEIDHARGELCEMAVHGEQKKPGRLRACSLILQSHSLIDAPGPKAFSASQSSAVIGTGTMEEIYKSQWLRDKEAALAARFEQELAPKQLAP